MVLPHLTCSLFALSVWAAPDAGFLASEGSSSKLNPLIALEAKLGRLPRARHRLTTGKVTGETYLSAGVLDADRLAATEGRAEEMIPISKEIYAMQSKTNDEDETDSDIEISEEIGSAEHIGGTESPKNWFASEDEFIRMGRETIPDIDQRIALRSKTTDEVEADTDAEDDEVFRPTEHFKDTRAAQQNSFDDVDEFTQMQEESTSDTKLTHDRDNDIELHTTDASEKLSDVETAGGARSNTVDSSIQSANHADELVNVIGDEDAHSYTKQTSAMQSQTNHAGKANSNLEIAKSKVHFKMKNHYANDADERIQKQTSAVQSKTNHAGKTNSNVEIARSNEDFKMENRDAKDVDELIQKQTSDVQSNTIHAGKTNSNVEIARSNEDFKVKHHNANDADEFITKQTNVVQSKKIDASKTYSNVEVAKAAKAQAEEQAKKASDYLRHAQADLKLAKDKRSDAKETLREAEEKQKKTEEQLNDAVVRERHQQKLGSVKVLEHDASEAMKIFNIKSRMLHHKKFPNSTGLRHRDLQQLRKSIHAIRELKGALADAEQAYISIFHDDNSTNFLDMLDEEEQDQNSSET